MKQSVKYQNPETTTTPNLSKKILIKLIDYMMMGIQLYIGQLVVVAHK